MRVTLLICLLSLVTACVSRSLPVDYYLLQAEATQAESAAQPPVPVRLLAVELADYLRRSALVVRNGSQLTINDDQQWGGALEDEITRVTIANLNRLSGAPQVQPATAPDRASTSIHLRIDRFDGTLGGELRLEGGVTILDSRGDVIARRQFAINEAAGSSVSTLVAAHSHALAKLAAIIDPLLPRP